VYLLYSVATLIALVALAPYFLYQALRHNKYVGSLGQRLGYLPVSFNLDAEESIWVHAVSVGEVLAARPIVAGLKARYPTLRVFLSTTTLSGQKLARSVSDADAVFYFPFDFTFIVRKTLNLVKPRLFVMVETEIWPNLLRECRRRNIRTALVNGRISVRSFPRYRIIRPFMRRVLSDVDRF
jgi:3-deoxy-D-manno-octulosonic-acid transferase